MASGEKFISKRINGKYYVRKTKDGVLIYFGGFDTLEAAVKYRDYCIKHDWDVRCKRRSIGRLFSISDMEMSEGVRIV